MPYRAFLTLLAYEVELRSRTCLHLVSEVGVGGP